MSKQYETWEVLKLIGENPNLKFQTTFSDGVIWEAFSRSNNKGVRCIYGKGTNSEEEDFLSSDSNTMSRLWKKVKQYLDFMTAFNEWFYKDKTIICELDGETCTFIPKRLCAQNISPVLIARGKWYIKD